MRRWKIELGNGDVAAEKRAGDGGRIKDKVGAVPPISDPIRKKSADPESAAHVSRGAIAVIAGV